jgi:hypothetical protein
MGTLRACLALSIAAIAGCASLTQDGQLLITPPGGKRGASVLTANGVEFMDSTELPRAIERRSASEPWRAPTGFLLPRDGVWRKTSTPVLMQGPGLGIVLRSSDVLVPAWGGEILLRIDAVAPAAAFPAAKPSIRAPIALAVILDAHDVNVAPLAAIALDDLGERDRVVLIDAAARAGRDGAHARTVVPLIPGANRTLLEAAIERLTATPSSPDEKRGDRAPKVESDLAGALALARRALAPKDPNAFAGTRQVLVLSDGPGASSEAIARERRALGDAGVAVAAIASTDDLPANALSALGPDVTANMPFTARQDANARLVPPPGDIVLSDVVLSLASVPAPSRLIELSGGGAGLSIDHDKLELGELYAGEARTEVARIAIPEWVPGEPLELTIEATYVDRASSATLSSAATIGCRYTEDVEAIASSRHGDVIAYASGLAMVRRLRRAFAGSEVDQLGGLRPVVTWQARSLSTLGRATGDAALSEQAEILSALLGAIDDD